MRELLRDFVRLFFPNLCQACGTGLVRGESVICLHCIKDIPKTYYWLHRDNPVELMLGGLPVVRGCAFFYLNKGGNYSRLLHKLKYSRAPQIGVALGRMFGAELAAAGYCTQDGAVVPVPLHPKRRRERGYNQSERIAFGISQVLGIPLIENAIVRRRYNETQTRKNREERLQNVSGIFGAGADIERLKGRHALVVDDVLTTGATLGACISALAHSVECRISAAALAMAK